MAKKLFALEEDNKVDTKANDLLIDKVLALKEKEKDPVSLTADIIQQRSELKKDIKEKLDEASQDEEDGDNNDSGNSDNDGDGSSGSDDNSSGNDNNNNSNDDGNNDSGSSDKNEDKDLSATAEDKDALKNSIGSGLNGGSDEGESNKDQPTEESFKTKVTMKNMFNPIRNIYDRYSVSMESFPGIQKLAIEETPVVYAKDGIKEALTNLVNIANVYVGKNKTYIENNTETVKSVNEKLTVLKQFIENRQYHFTNKLINEHDLLAQVSVLNKSNIRETIKYLTNYAESSSKLVNYILNNTFDQLNTGLINSEFIAEEGDYIYKDMLPGFNMVRVHLDQYNNYLKANIENFHYYTLRTFKTENLYNLEAISIADDKELDFIMSGVDKLLIDLSMTIDNFNVVNTNLNKLIDELKVIIFDVESDKYPNLAALDIDSKVKDFIKFKLVSEAYYNNVALFVNYMLNVMTIINKCIELKVSTESYITYPKRDGVDFLEWILKDISEMTITDF